MLWENRSTGFPTRRDTNQAVQQQKIARGLKFRIKEVQELYCENKGTNALVICNHGPPPPEGGQEFRRVFTF